MNIALGVRIRTAVATMTVGRANTIVYKRKALNANEEIKRFWQIVDVRTENEGVGGE